MTDISRRDSRSLILKAARQEFGQLGYAGGRVDRIARRAGVNKQLIFYYFGSKAGLFKTVIESASPDLAQTGRTAVGVGPLEQLRATLEGAFVSLTANADLVRASVLGSGAGEGPGGPLTERLDWLGRRVRALVSDAQGLGFVRDDVDPGAVAHLAVALVVGSAALPTASDDDRRRSQIDVLIRGLSW